MAGSFLPPAVFEIKAIADEAIAKFQDVNKELDKMGKTSDEAGGKISKLDKASKIATAGVIALGTAFAGFAAYGIKEAQESEQALSKLGVTLSNFGINTAKVRGDIEQLTNAYVDLGFGGEEAAAGFDVLLRTTGDVTKSQNLLATAADLARAKNISLADASAILGKASMGNAKAFKDLGITLDETLPKNEAISKAMGELNAKIGGQAVAYTKTLAGQMKVMKEKFADVAETLGTTLIPYIKKFLDFIKSTVEWVQKNSAWLSVLAGVVLTVTLALAAYNATVKIVTATTKAWTVISGVAKAIQTLLTTGQWQLNAALNANPIGLVVAGLVLLAGVMVIAWNKSETFRKAMIKVFQVLVNGVGYIVGAIGSLLKLASKLPGVGDKFKGMSDTVNEVANNIRNFSDGLDKLNNKKIGISFSGPKIPEVPNVGGAKGSGGGDSQAKATIKKNNEDYLKIVKDLNDKVEKAKKDFHEKMASAEKKYTDKVAELNKKASDAIAKAEKDAADKKAKLRTDASDKIAKLEKDAEDKRVKLRKDTDDKIKDLQTKFNDEMGTLNKKKADDLAKLTLDNSNKIAEITKAGQEKLASIVQQSVDRLRNAFQQGTAFKVGDLFKGLVDSGKASAEELIKVMREKLTAAKTLAENASKLASKGFSQTFIEQVVSAGPEIGNQLSDSILNSTPETIKELQSLYKDLEGTNENGLDNLAVNMNKGANLATAELTKAYAEAQKDTASALAKQNADYLAAQTEINKAFSEAMAQAERERDTAIASAKKDLDEAIAEVDKVLKDSIKEVNDDLAKALAEVEQNLADTRAEINANLAESLTEAYNAYKEETDAIKKDLADTLDTIQKDFDEKLGKITDATKKTAKEINALVTSFNTTKKLLETPIVIPAPIYAGTSGGGSSSSSSSKSSSSTPSNTTVINNNVNGYNLTSPSQTADQVVSMIKFGQTVTSTPVRADTVTTGLSAAKMNQLTRYAL